MLDASLHWLHWWPIVPFWISIRSNVVSRPKCSVGLQWMSDYLSAFSVVGVGADGTAGEKNLHDADFTVSLFRFCQLLCEGHNLEFQNYLRLQAGSNTNVNIIICTVDYLLSLQVRQSPETFQRLSSVWLSFKESLMDFYWHYSGKETVDAHGKENFCRAITVAKQVFNTLTEYIQVRGESRTDPVWNVFFSSQGPCPQNQLALANSRLWDAISGFLYIFAHMQRKLSQVRFSLSPNWFDRRPFLRCVGSPTNWTTAWADEIAEGYDHHATVHARRWAMHDLSLHHTPFFPLSGNVLNGPSKSFRAMIATLTVTLLF